MKMLNVLALSIFLTVVASPVLALERSLNLNLGLDHTDNGERAEFDQISDTEQQAGLGLVLAHEGKKLQAGLDYSVVKNSYENNTQSSNTDINGQLNITYQPLEGTVFVRLDSSTRNIAKGQAAIDIADNRQNRTITTLAPEWVLRPTQADQVILGLSYSDISYEDDEQNSDRRGVTVTWLHQLSKVDSLSAGLNYYDVQFDSTDQDYGYYQGYFNYTAALSKINYSINVGYNETRRDEGVNVGDVDGGFIKATFAYAAASSSWGLDVGRELTDNSRGNNNAGLEQFSDFYNDISAIGIYELTSVRASWSGKRVCAACTVNGHLSYEQEDYEDSPNDSERMSVSIGFSYELNRFTSLSLSATYLDYSFTNELSSINDYNRIQSRIQLSRKFGRDLSIQLFARNRERNSQGPFDSYEEIAGGISLSYAIF